MRTDTGADADRAVAPAPAPPGRRACVVLLAGLPFAVDVLAAREVVTLDVVTPVPGAPSTLLGVTNVRGHLLAVADARPLLGLPAPPLTGGTQALVVAAGRLQAGLAIDRAVGLAWFDGPRPAPAAVEPGAAFVTGTVDHEGAVVPLLDAGRLLDALRAPWSAPVEDR